MGHQHALAELLCQVKPQVPAGLQSMMAVDIDLEFATAGQPATSRRPDLIVAESTALDELRDSDRMIRASEVVLVAELVAQSTRRLDTLVKHREYADAGILSYWIIELDKPVSLTECRRTEGSGYQDVGAVTGTFRTTVPCDLTIDLESLRYT